ncbi:hypothetical protein KKG48_03635 [Patescibacteria group bacterium]|nr:hypothetical protein [Patescibacteria group bacterium]MCG2694705.1 hypothetical protein [Candidatus Parcubacteria bacterium]
MRKILSLSFSPTMADEIKKETEKNGYMSQSEFFRDIYRQWKENSFIPYLEEVPKKEITKEMRKKIEQTKKLKRSELFNI